jgi:DNA-directed RNA polymerase specialized sigma subunit
VSEHTGRAWREGSWWVVEVDGVGATQAKTLDKVDHMARALVADLLDEPYESVTVSVTITLPDDVSQQVEDMNTTAERAAQMSREAAEMQRAIVGELRRQDLSGREIAVILKVTPGRISQIEASHTGTAQTRPTRRSA